MELYQLQKHYATYKRRRAKPWPYIRTEWSRRKHESALNLFKHRDSAFAVQQPGVKWGWRYKPTNGLMFQAKSAMQHGPPIFYDPGAANRPRLS